MIKWFPSFFFCKRSEFYLFSIVCFMIFCSILVTKVSIVRFSFWTIITNSKRNAETIKFAYQFFCTKCAKFRVGIVFAGSTRYSRFQILSQFTSFVDTFPSWWKNSVSFLFINCNYLLISHTRCDLFTIPRYFFHDILGNTTTVSPN